MKGRSKRLPDLRCKAIRGQKVPSVGFGTQGLKGLPCLKAVLAALETGYRHIDTARGYGNNIDVGAAIQKSGLEREEIFLTTAIRRDSLRAPVLRAQVEQSLDVLGSGYIDLVFIECPDRGPIAPEVIPVIQELKDARMLRHFGVMNFTAERLGESVRQGEVFCNRVDFHPMRSLDSLLGIAAKEDILITACPGGPGWLSSEIPVLSSIAGKHGKRSAQVAIRWLLEQDNVAVVTTATTPEEIAANFNVFDFSLDEDDHALIRGLVTGRDGGGWPGQRSPGS